MASVNEVRSGYCPEPVVHPNGKDRRVDKAAKPFLETARETVSWSWRVTVIGVRVAGERVSIVFFQIFNWIHPSIGPRIEVIWLRISGAFSDIKNAWKQQEVRAEMSRLRERNRDLEVLAERQTPLAGRCAQLERENETLKTQAGENAFLKENMRLLEERIKALKEEVKAAEAREESAPDFEKEKEQLVLEKNGLAQLLTVALAANQQLQEKIALHEKSVPYLEAHVESMKAMQGLLSKIPQATQNRDQSELDDILETILPLLLKQMGNANASLELAKGQFSDTSPQQMALLNVGRILSEVGLLLKNIPEAMKRHAQWQNPAAQFYQKVEA